jgi:hypothetical protein
MPNLPHRHRPAAHDRGFSLLVVSAAAGLAFAFAYVLIEAVLTANRAGTELKGNLTERQIADAGLQKAIFCLNTSSGEYCGGTSGPSFIGETGIAFGGGTYTTAIVNSGDKRSVTVIASSAAGRELRAAMNVTSVPPNAATDFSFALQAGLGGAYLADHAVIGGALHADGDIECQSGTARVAGDARSSKAGGRLAMCEVAADAGADNLIGAIVHGDAYYLSVNGGTVDGARHPGQPTPPARDLPAFDASFWHDSATAGGTIDGDYSPADNSHLGPVKIDGDLIMGDDVDIVVDGPIWIKGDLVTGSNGGFALNGAFGQFGTVILADDPDDRGGSGRINLAAGADVSGSGQPTSHILFVSTNTSTSDTQPAVTVGSASDDAVFYAPDGALRLDDDAGAKAVAGYRLYVGQNAAVNRDQSAIGNSFSNSPGGVWRKADSE